MTASPRPRPHGMRPNPRLIGVLVWAAGTFVVAFFLVVGISQLFREIPSYTIEDFSANILKGGSPIGFKLAYFGTILLVTGQFYTLRKAVTGLPHSRVGSRRSWLRAHCYLDVAGALLLLMHSGFPLSFRYANPFPYLRLNWGLIGLVGTQGFAAWLVLVTTISGLVGEQLRRSALGSCLLRPWLRTHILLTCLLFVFGIIHLIIVFWLKYVSAG